MFAIMYSTRATLQAFDPSLTLNFRQAYESLPLRNSILLLLLPSTDDVRTETIAKSAISYTS